MASSPLNTEVLSGDKSGRSVSWILGNPGPGYFKNFPLWTGFR